MGFLNDQNRKAVGDHIFKSLTDLKKSRNGLGLSKRGINWVGDMAFAHFDQFNTVGWRRVADLLDEAQSYAVFREDYPHPDDKQLENITSIEAARGLARQALKKLTNDIAPPSGS